jgi:Putative prokaryotic signal transducing protein
MSSDSLDGWITVFETGTDYEAHLVRDRLDDADIRAVVMTHRDSAFSLNVGDMSTIRVLVHPERAGEARRILSESPLTDAELTAAALDSDPDLGED